MPTPVGPRSSQALNGVVPGMTWAQFMQSLTPESVDFGDPTNGSTAQNWMLGSVPGYGGAVRGLPMGTQSGNGSVTGYGDYSTNNLGDGTINSFSQGPNGELISTNHTLNNDSFWDATGLPAVVALAFGGAAAGLGSAVGAGSGSAAGVGSLTGEGALASQGAYDAALSGVGSNAGEAVGSLSSSGIGSAADIGSAAYNPWNPANWSASADGSTASDAGGFAGNDAGSNLGGYSDARAAAQSGIDYNGGLSGASNTPTAGGWASDFANNPFQTASNALKANGFGNGTFGSINNVVSGNAGIGDYLSAASTANKAIGLGSSLFGSGNGMATSGFSNNNSISPGTGGTDMSSIGSILQALSGQGSNLTNPSVLNGLAQLAGGIYSGVNAGKNTQEIMNAADPFNQYRQNYATSLNNLFNTNGYANKFSPTGVDSYVATNQPLNSATLANLSTTGAANAGDYNALNGIGTTYNNLLQNPSAIFNDPTYQAETAQGSEAVQRALAARGLTNSGNEQQALQDYGTANSAQYLQQRLSNLSNAYTQNVNANNLGYGNAYNTNTANMAANQLGYNEAQGDFSSNLTGNQQQFQQLALASGLSQGNLGAAALALSNQGAMTQGALTGIGSSLSSLGSSLGNWFNGSGTTDASNLGFDFTNPNSVDSGLNYGITSQLNPNGFDTNSLNLFGNYSYSDPSTVSNTANSFTDALTNNDATNWFSDAGGWW